MPKHLLDPIELVPALETCQELAEAGFSHRTQFYWFKRSPNAGWGLRRWRHRSVDVDSSRAVAAPTAPELGVLIPEAIYIDGCSYALKLTFEHAVYASEDGSGKDIEIFGDTEAELRANVWLELQRRSLLSD